jgi:hypothetical protein
LVPRTGVALAKTLDEGGRSIEQWFGGHGGRPGGRASNNLQRPPFLDGKIILHQAAGKPTL